MEHKGELFLIAFVAALVAVPVIDYLYNYVAAKISKSLPQV
jgi:hypothetical protein